MSLGARPKILIAEPDAFDAEVGAMLAARADVTFEHIGIDRLPQAFVEYDAIWIRLGYRITAEVLRRGRCRALACPVTGLDHIDLAACHAHNVSVISLKGEVEFLRDVRATAEHTMALALSLLRRLPSASQSVLDGEWNRDRFRGHELHEKTVGIVGVGRLGSLFAKMLRGFDAVVIGYDPRSDFPSDLAIRVSSLHELLERADLVSLHVPYEPPTRHLIGARELSIMRFGASLINTSRGGVLDEQALLAALESGRLGGAALDVMENEPLHLRGTNPLVEYAKRHQNLVLSPHIGGNTWESTRKTEDFIARKLLAALGLGTPS